jgi:hypothetical protein
MSTADKVINFVDPEFSRGMLWVIFQAPDAIDDLLNHEELNSDDQKCLDLLVYLGFIQINTMVVFV